MSIDDYKRALEAACREYEDAAAQHAALETRIAQLKQTIGTLNKLCGYEATVPWSLTDACRVVLRSAGAPMTAVQVRDRIESIGLDLDRYQNALGAVHTVLKRLAESGEVAPIERDETTRVAFEFLGSGIVASRTGMPRPVKNRIGRSRK